MAPLPVIADTYRVALEWDNPGSGGTAANILHVEGTSSTLAPAAIFACINAHVTANMWATVAPTMFVDAVNITPLDGSSASQLFPTGGGAKWTGAGSGDPIPNMATVLKLTTPLRGRSFRGRLFLPAVPEGDQANGQLATGPVASAQAAWDTFRAAIFTDATTPLSIAVASYKLSVATIVTGTLIESAAATQRRRQTRLR